MKTSITLLALLATCGAAFAAQPAPVSMGGKLVVVNFYSAQEANSELGERPSTWKECRVTPMMMQFPAGGGNEYSYQLQEQTPESPWPPVKVTYIPEDSCIQITGNDMHVQVTLTFNSPQKGTASIEWHDEGGSWYIRGAEFSVSKNTSRAGLLTMPQEEATDGAVQSVDDGLGDLVRELEARTYSTAVERLYQRRLLTILPQIMEGAPIDTIISNANGTTALHNACGLSHVELVRWLVEHGANVRARTARGASVADCVGGPNAAAINAILRSAR